MRTEHVKRNIDTNTSSSQNLSCELLFYALLFLAMKLLFRFVYGKENQLLFGNILLQERLHSFLY